MCQQYQLRGSLQSTHSESGVILKGEKPGGGEEAGRNMERACGKWKDGGEKSKRLSDGWVEFDSERESKERGEKAWLPKRERENSVFQRISLSQSLTHYIHSSLSARPWQLHKLAERGFLGKAFDQVCVCVCVCCVSEREERERCTFVHTWTSDVCVSVCVWKRPLLCFQSCWYEMNAHR